MKSHIILLMLILISPNLQSKDIIILEEDEANLLIGIISISINNDNTKLLITNRSQKNVILYEAETGKIINTFVVNQNLSDSLANCNKKPFNYENKEWIFTDAIKLKEQYNIDKTKNNYLTNQFFDAFFDKNNKIVISALLTTYILELNSYKTLISGSSSILSCDDSLNLESVVIIENTKNGFSRKILGVSDNVLYIQLFKDRRTSATDQPSIAIYDHNGFYVKKYIPLPDFYTQKKTWSTIFNSTPYLTLNDDSLIYIYPYDNKIQFGYSKKTIKLKNIEIDNLLHYEKVEEFLNSDPDVLKKVEYFPVQVNNIFSNKNYIFLFLSLKIDKNTRYQLMQKYNINSGKLLNEGKVNNIIRFQPFTMSKDCKYIYTTALEDENYVVRKHEVESLWEK